MLDRRLFSALLILLAVSAPCGGQEEKKEETKKELLPLVLAPPPAFVSRKARTPERLLRQKREGQYVTGFPAIGWDQENGFVFGAFLQLFDNGSKQDGFFAHAPYRTRTLFGGTFSTEGVADVALGIDLPYFLDSPYRLRAGIGFTRNPISNYYGVGDEVMGKLRFSGSSRRFKRHKDYVEALRDSPDAQTSYTRYVQWTETALGGTITLERDLLGGILRPLLGYRARYTDVDDYTGERVKGDNAVFDAVKVRQVSTKLAEDDARGRIAGFGGGFDSVLRLGLTLDTRDFEPDPSSGFLVMAAAEVSTRVLGSQFDYQRVSVSASVYHDLIPSVTRLVVAARVAYSAVFGSAPFYELSTLARTTLNLEGLGGYGSLRGLKRKRFVGQALALANLELRWTFYEMEKDKDHFRFGLVAYGDLGRAYDSVQLDLRRWRAAGGGGFRFTWNLSTVIGVDVAASGEDEIFYVSFGHPF